MANRRMFARTITESDSFLDLAKDAQLLWFHLGMVADDDGFVNSTRKVAALCGIDIAALNELEQGGFVIRFDSGVYVIRDWHICNQIRKDRYAATKYQNELSELELRDGSYVRLPLGCHEVAVVKDRLVESSKGECSSVEDREDKEREGAEGKTFRSVPCPECGNACAASRDELGNLHAWCAICKGNDFYVNNDGEYIS